MFQILLRNNVPDKPLHKVVENSISGIQTLLAFVGKKTSSATTDLHIVLEATSVDHETAA